jgi:hypothetical protein
MTRLDALQPDDWEATLLFKIFHPEDYRERLADVLLARGMLLIRLEKPMALLEDQGCRNRET